MRVELVVRFTDSRIRLAEFKTALTQSGGTMKPDDKFLGYVISAHAFRRRVSSELLLDLLRESGSSVLNGILCRGEACPSVS
jgi:hypothetical protein